MKLRRIIAGLTILSLPLLAQAHPLSIANGTSSPLSFMVNNVCSNDIGTIYEKEISTVNEETLNKICGQFLFGCEIVGYAGQNCEGQTTGGIRYITEHDVEVFGGEARVNVSATESSLIYSEPSARK